MIDVDALRSEAKKLTALTEQQLDQEAVFVALLRNALSRQESDELADMDRRFLQAIGARD